jgi:hypothetical protein
MNNEQRCYVCKRDVEVKPPKKPAKQPTIVICGKSCAEAYNKVRLYRGLTTTLN